MNRNGLSRVTRSIGAFALALCLGTIGGIALTQTVTTPTAGASSSALCHGFTSCTGKGYSTHDYRTHWDTSFWRMTPGDNCTNYAAYVESTVYGAPTPSYLLGNAATWAGEASAHGVTVNSTPSVGAVAQWNSSSRFGLTLGHVAVVEAVTDTNHWIRVSQDDVTNTAATTGFDWDQISFTQPSTSWEPYPNNFIHFVTTGGGGTPPLPAPTPNGGSMISGVGSGLCLDVINAGTTEGTRVQLYSCNNYAQQQWIYNNGQLQVYGNYGLCLDANSVQGGANGTIIQVWDCTNGSNQQWTAEPDGTIRSVAYGSCLDAVNAGTTDGTLLQLWACNGGTNQAWIGAPTPNGGEPIQGTGSGRCLDVPGASISPGTRPTTLGLQWKRSATVAHGGIGTQSILRQVS